MAYMNRNAAVQDICVTLRIEMHKIWMIHPMDHQLLLLNSRIRAISIIFTSSRLVPPAQASQVPMDLALQAPVSQILGPWRARDDPVQLLSQNTFGSMANGQFTCCFSYSSAYLYMCTSVLNVCSIRACKAVHVHLHLLLPLPCNS